MKRIYTLLTALIISLSSVVQAQVESCGFDAVHQEMMQTNDDYAKSVENFNLFVEQNRHVFETSSRGTVYRIPVVVHVMHLGEDEGVGTNVSTQGIKDAIAELNERFRKVAGGLGDGNGDDVEVEFALAVTDPNGNCTDGIVRFDLSGDATYAANGVYRSTAGITDAALKAYSVWDQTKYYNIWLVSEIDNNGGGGGIQGYAYFASSHGTSIDGTVILGNKFVTPGNTTATHELGHAFNLYHTFQGDGGGASCPSDADCGTNGDCCADTPIHKRSASDCDDTGTNTCTLGSKSLYVYHYMDYSSDACQNMFSTDQVTRMRAAVLAERASYQSANSLSPSAKAEVDFRAETLSACGTGTSIQFFDESSCTPNTYINTAWSGISFSWSFDNNTDAPYTSTDQNPTITFNNSGTYDVSLTVTNAHGAASTTKKGYIVIDATPTAACSPTSTNAGNFAETLYRVQFNTIDNSTDENINVAYTDFACTQNTIVGAGLTYNISLTLNASGGTSGNRVVEASIDYNDDGDFDDSEELVYSGSIADGQNSTIGGAVTIPSTAIKDNLLRMRVIGETGTISATERACGGNYFIGDVEDYAVLISSNYASVSVTQSPTGNQTYGTNITMTATPTNGGAGPTYQWYKNGSPVSGETASTYASTTFVDGDEVYCVMSSNLAGVVNSPATSNTVTLSITGTPISNFSFDENIICENSSINFTDESDNNPTSWSWSFAGGTPATSTSQNPTITYATAGTYSVTLTASNGEGTGTTMIKTDSITVVASPTAACTITRSSTPGAGGIGIHNVSFASISNPSDVDDDALVDYSCTQFTELDSNTTYTVNVTRSSSNNQWVGVYLDYNNDGDFNDANETIATPGATATGVFTVTFTTPASPPVKDKYLRFRVISDFVNTTGSACENPVQYGQAEDYSVYFLTPNGCSSPTASITATAASCATGNDNGSLEVGVTGGETPYTYLWSNSNTTANPTGLTPGVYTVTVTENEGCTTVTSGTVTSPPALTVAFNQTATDCVGSSDGIVDADVSGGVTAYTYLWSTTATTQQITGLNAGTYTVTITDNNSCMASNSATITDPAAITITPNVSNALCFGSSDGSITVTPSGGTPAFTFEWSNSATTNIITGLPAGNYIVTATDANSCEGSLTVTVGQPAVLDANTNYNNASCNDANGWIVSSSPTGGTTPYAYLWFNSATTSSVTGLTTGTYALTVTDGNACKDMETVTVSNRVALAITVSGVNVDCNGASTGSTSTNLTGGGTPYSYLWNNSSTTSGLSNLPVGEYSVTVTDIDNCTITDAVTLTEPSALSLTLVATSVTCYGQSTGSISSTPSGGTTPYSFLWSNGATTQNVASLAAGSYTLTTTDNNSCTIIDSETISQPVPLIATATAADLQPGSGNALDFNGSATYVDYTGSISVTSHSIMTWVNTTVSSGDHYLAMIYNGSSQFSTIYINAAGNVVAHVKQASFSEEAVQSAGTVDDGNWHHIALSYNNSGSSLNLYIDGVLDNGSVLSDDNPNFNMNSSNMHVGADFLVGSYFDGLMDELVIYNEALSQAQIRNNMCQKMSASNADFCDVIAYYRFDEGSGSTAKDWTGTNNGTITSGTYVTSGAPLGDESAHDYNGTTSSVNLAHTDGDDITLTASAGTLSGLHAYRVDEQPGQLGGINATDNDRYFGVYVVGTSATYDASINYAGHPYGVASAEADILMFSKAGNEDATWVDLGEAPNTTTDIIDYTGDTRLRAEYILHLNRAVWTGATDTDWGTAANWSPAAVPSSGSHITIPDVTNQPVLDQNRTVGNILVETDATLSLGTFTLLVENDLEVRGSLINGTGTVEMVGTDDQNINGNMAFNNLTINNSATGVTIESGTDSIYGTLTLSNGNLTTNNQLVLVSNASGTARIASIAAGSSIAGSIVAQRYLANTNSGYRYLTSPVVGSTLADWNDDFVTTGYTGSSYPNINWVSIYSYDETVAGIANNSGWTAVTNANQSTSGGNGYAAWVQSTPTIVDVTGVPTQGDVVISLDYTNNGTPSEDGWNLIGNPYMSTIDWDDPDWSKSGVNDAVYVWDPVNNQIASYVSGVGNNGGTQYISSSQAFAVQTNAASPAITITEGAKSTNDQPFRSGGDRDQILRLELTNVANGLTDQTTIVFDSAATPAYEVNWDARKMKGLNPNTPYLSTFVSNEYFSINTLNAYDKYQVIPLKVEAAASTSLKLNVVQLPDMVGDMCYQLLDLENGAVMDITSDLEYTFNATNGATPRFEIRHCCQDFEVDAEINQFNCLNNTEGSVSLEFTGGTTPYTYSWNSTDLMLSQNHVENTLSPGLHTVVLSDNKVCSETFQISINDPSFDYNTAASMASDVNNSDGSAEIIINNESDYNINWSNGESGAVISNIMGGTYQVSVTNKSTGCTVVKTVEVPACNINTSISKDQAICGNDIGAITISGNSSYNYNWSNNLSGNVIENLAVGTYTVTITDQNSCVKVNTISITGTSLVQVSLNAEDPSCNSTNGSIEATVTGGNSQYSFNWSNSDGTIISTNSMAQNLPEGEYNLSVTDSDGCSVTESYELISPDNIDVITYVNNETIAGANDGIAGVEVNGGTGSYTYLWSTGDITNSVTGLGAGTYSVTVTDDNGCSDVVSMKISTGVTSLKELVNVSSVTIFPNPNNGKFSVWLSVKSHETINLRVTNLIGETIQEKQLNLAPGRQVINVDMNNEGSGVYFIQLKTTEHIHTERFVVK